MSTDIAFLLQPRGKLARPLDGGVHPGSPARARQGQGHPQAQAFARLLSKSEARQEPASEDTGRAAVDEKAPRGREVAKGRDTEHHFANAADAVSSEPLPPTSMESGAHEEGHRLSEAGDGVAPIQVSLPDASSAVAIDVTRPALVRPDDSGPPAPSAALAVDPVRAADHPAIAAVGVRPDAPHPRTVSDRPGSQALPLPAETVTARVVVERVESHHAPASLMERLQALSAWPHRPLEAARSAATSDPAVSGDTADSLQPGERRQDAAGGRERVAASEHAAASERWRPERRGDMASGSGGRRGWETFSPAPSAASAAGVAGSEAVRQDFFHTDRDASPQPGTLVAPIASSLLAAVEDLQVAEIAPAGPAAGPQQAAPSGTPVKSLELTLLPDQLGPIAVRMRLENGALTISMKAHSHDDTAALVVEREAIEDSLRKSGHAIDAITVSIAPEPAAGPGDSGPSQQATHQGGGDAGGGRSEATGAGTRDRDGQRPPSAQFLARGQAGGDEVASSDRSPRRGPGMYV